MVAACGLGYFNLAFFHLITHAFFKSLLFLCAGVIIHTMSGEQDIRKMGGLRNVLPLTFVGVLIASWSLSGIPYLSGYYSKELIINAALLHNSWVGLFVGLILVVSAIFTSFYSAKLIYFVFFSTPR
jgi:NADH:ubiquinone oxidoreductase subunit 5 (subunit L)/multisubunit Na+/H+ antiporter MnhA subunit